MNNLSRFGTRHADTQIAVVQCIGVSSFTLYKNRPVWKLVVRPLSEEMLFILNHENSSANMSRNNVSVPQLCESVLNTLRALNKNQTHFTNLWLLLGI